MYSFKTWLIEKGYTQRPIKDFLNRIKRLDSWLDKYSLTYHSFTYQRLLDYMGELQGQGKSRNSINTTLRTIEHYYNYLNEVTEEIELPNIALNVRQRGVTREQPLLLTPDELDHMYNNYKEYNSFGYFKYSNKLFIGLMIYQAIYPTELYTLEVNDVNLEKGTIYIRGGSHKKNSRTLSLKAHQILPLQYYITNYRAIPHPLQEGNPQGSIKLFSPNCDKRHRLDDQLKILSKSMQGQYPNLKSLRQLVQSRISIWIGQYGLRKAQYLSGYRAINSVERYRGMDMEDLTKQVEKYHPLQ